MAAFKRGCITWAPRRECSSAVIHVHECACIRGCACMCACGPTGGGRHADDAAAYTCMHECTHALLSKGHGKRAKMAWWGCGTTTTMFR